MTTDPLSASIISDPRGDVDSRRAVLIPEPRSLPWRRAPFLHRWEISARSELSGEG